MKIIEMIIQLAVMSFFVAWAKGTEVGKAYQGADAFNTGAASTKTTVFLNPKVGSGEQEGFFSGNETGQGMTKIGTYF